MDIVSPMVNVVLFQPENPYNTGAVVRTCALFGAGLHLIRPYGFESLDGDVRRASMGYLDDIVPIEHASWEAFIAFAGDARVLAMWDEGRANLQVTEFAFGDFLLFGRESVGLPTDITSFLPTVRIEMPGPNERRHDHRDHSLNLSVSVGIVLFQALRQVKR